MSKTAVTSPHALVVYATTHGHTAKIAARLAEVMREAGIDVHLRDIGVGAAVLPDAYDLIVVGASLHRASHQLEIADWVRGNLGVLAERPTAFFSVSLSAAEETDAAIAATQGAVDEFCADTGWTPGRTERIAGCLQYREYDAFTRQLMRLMMRRVDRPTDASRDYDYTDWDAVSRLGGEFAALAAHAAAPA